MQGWYTIRLLYAGKSVAGIFKLNCQGLILKIMFWSFNLVKNLGAIASGENLFFNNMAGNLKKMRNQ
jgi:hypothetical protein